MVLVREMAGLRRMAAGRPIARPSRVDGESRAGGRAAGRLADLEGLEAHRVRLALQAAQPVLRDPARNKPLI
jgi:hypothetical protein